MSNHAALDPIAAGELGSPQRGVGARQRFHDALARTVLRRITFAVRVQPQPRLMPV